MSADDNCSITRWQVPTVDAAGAPVMRYHRKPSEDDRDPFSDEKLSAIYADAARQGYQQAGGARESRDWRPEQATSRR